ncbi:hypothetical protein HGRIS_012406 [Hohenbuehelia grisea]|uniref:Serine-rich protein n=1 Tax=Hohenbuehelia grisea TaxID=104357 RepID=A0ABR3IS51_9AGAR
MFQSLIHRLSNKTDGRDKAPAEAALEDPFADPPDARRLPHLSLSTSVLGKVSSSTRAASLSSDELEHPPTSSAWQRPHPSPIRATPPNLAWLTRDEGEDSEDTDTNSEQFTPTMVRPPAPVAAHRPFQVHALSRSNSLPSSSTPMSSTPGSSPGPSTPKWSLRLQTNPAFAGSSQSLRLDSRHSSLGDEAYGGYSYPMVKQLSPILEQRSPESMRSNPLTRMSEHGVSSVYSQANRSPNGSQFSDITRPSPIFSNAHPFITRPLNRTISQTSSRTHVSTTSTLPREAPCIPPLDLRPSFSGPHPSSTYSSSGLSLRPLKSATTPTMPTIAGSEDDSSGGATVHDSNTSRNSRHADSFVTCTDAMESPAADYEISLDTPIGPANDVLVYPTADARRGASHNAISVHSSEHSASTDPEAARQVPSADPSSAHPSSARSISSGFIYQRWERDVALGPGSVTFPRLKAKKQRFAYTPACWMFWLCFLCPPLWFVGGWYITIFAEAYTFREPDEDWHWWGVRSRVSRKWKGKTRALELPQWVREKQQTSDGASSTGRALRGISYLYPFVARPIDPPPLQPSLGEKLLRTLGKVNRVFDRIPYVKLEVVDGEKETDRRMFDPWIQRCRYAWCWFFVLWCCVGVPALFIVRQYCTTCLRDV